MVPPTWTRVVSAARPGSVLTARLVVSARLSLAGLIVEPAPAPDDQAIADAALAAQDAATAIVVVGLTPGAGDRGHRQVHPGVARATR